MKRSCESRKSLRLQTLALPLFAVLFLVSNAAAHRVRVFTVNPRVELRYAATYADYHDKMAALIDAAAPRRTELVQADVDDVASHIRPQEDAAPANVLVAFPEDVGLVAGLIGSRGAAARQATAQLGGSTAAFIALNLAYQPQIAYYRHRFPGLPGLRALFLAETDTYYRAFYETFRELAHTYDVHIAASVNVAPARRVTAAENPQLVALLRDPDEPERGYAYEAASPKAVNTLFVFAPDGEVLVRDAEGNTVSSPSQTDGVIQGSLAKAYLTEIEQDPLGLAYGAVRDLGVLDTPVGRLASVISKDAWMIDVNDRYDAQRPQLVLQAEAFDSWGFTAEPWSPDGFKAGGFAQVQRNPSFLFNVTPCLIGNLFEITFDGQGTIIGKRRKGLSPVLSPQSAWIGQNPDSAYVAIAPWIRADPALLTAGLTLAARRTQLAAAGEKLLPDSGVACVNDFGACENGYRESIIYADLDLPDPGAPPQPARTPGPRAATTFEPSISIDPPAAGEQRHPRIAAYAGRVYVTWQDNRSGVDNVYLGVSEDEGQTYSVRRVSDNPAGTVAEMRPDLALRPDGEELFVAWQELCGVSEFGCGRIEMARFDQAGEKLGPDVRVDAGGDGAGKWNPSIAVARDGAPMVVWVDERDHGPEAIPLEHIYFARSRDGGQSMGPSIRVDAGMPVPTSTSLDNKWAPRVAVRGRFIEIVWADFRDYNWDIYGASSHHGLHFNANVRVDDAVGYERLHGEPAIAVDRYGGWHVVWPDRRGNDPVTAIRSARGDAGGRRFGPSQRVDAAGRSFDPDTDTPNNQWHPAIAASGNDVFVAWQDNRLGDNDIFSARSRDRGVSFEADERVDDSGDDPSDQDRPAIAVDDSAPTGRMIYVAWEDERGGAAAITIARRRLSQAGTPPRAAGSARRGISQHASRR